MRLIPADIDTNLSRDFCMDIRNKIFNTQESLVIRPANSKDTLIKEIDDKFIISGNHGDRVYFKAHFEILRFYYL